jgi:hypothetical protein
VDYGKRVTGVDLVLNNSDEVLREIKHLSCVEALMLYGPAVTDSSLLHLGGLRRLTHVILSDSRVSDSGLVHLRAITSLEVLYLSRARLTDSGMVQLVNHLSHVRYLTLDNTGVTEEGVERIRRLRPEIAIDLRKGRQWKMWRPDGIQVYDDIRAAAPEGP